MRRFAFGGAEESEGAGFAGDGTEDIAVGTFQTREEVAETRFGAVGTLRCEYWGGVTFAGAVRAARSEGEREGAKGQEGALRGEVGEDVAGTETERAGRCFDRSRHTGVVAVVTLGSKDRLGAASTGTVRALGGRGREGETGRAAVVTRWSWRGSSVAGTGAEES